MGHEAVAALCGEGVGGGEGGHDFGMINNISIQLFKGEDVSEK